MFLLSINTNRGKIMNQKKLIILTSILLSTPIYATDSPEPASPQSPSRKELERSISETHDKQETSWTELKEICLTLLEKCADMGRSENLANNTQGQLGTLQTEVEILQAFTDRTNKKRGAALQEMYQISQTQQRAINALKSTPITSVGALDETVSECLGLLEHVDEIVNAIHNASQSRDALKRSMSQLPDDQGGLWE